MAKKANPEVKRKRSEIISDFLDLLRESVVEYDYNYEEVHRRELLATDLDHKLELQELSYHEYANIAKQIKQCQKERRIYKDEAEELEPLATWMKNNQGTMSNITKLLGEVRKIETKHAERGYMPRVMTMEEWSGIK